MTKKPLFALIVFAFLLFAVTARAYAAFDLKKAIITPDNPLYFIKEITRSVQRSLTIEDISKVELDLNISDSLASEIVAIAEKDPSRVSEALENYSADLDVLKKDLSTVQAEGKEQSVLRITELIADRMFAHDRLLSLVDVKKLSTDADISAVRGKVLDILVFTAENISGWEKFSMELEKAFSEISSVEEALAAMDLFTKLEGAFFGCNDGCVDRKEFASSLYEAKRVLLLRTRDFAEKMSDESIALYFKNIPEDLSKLRIAVDLTRFSLASGIKQPESVLADSIIAGEKALALKALSFTQDLVGEEPVLVATEGDFFQSFFLARSAFLDAFSLSRSTKENSD
ncbi:MAG: DUF5667 domain-containing protein [Candidatus Colwellbacteria bacterium]|nr:DUF5667 domain-containing protein [Candidatus Colwellbacteria bacterium]